MSELYAIVSASSGQMLWAGLAEREEAEERAVVKAVNHGNVNLLSGDDLGRFLTEKESNG